MFTTAYGSIYQMPVAHATFTYDYTTLIGSISKIIDTLNTASAFTSMASGSPLTAPLVGYLMGQMTKPQLLANYTKWMDDLYASWTFYDTIYTFYVFRQLYLMGLENETRIKLALDRAEIMTCKLPDSQGDNRFCTDHRGALWGYWFAQYYNYGLDKWNVTAAYLGFRAATLNATIGVHYVSDAGVGDTGSGRYYDEYAQTLDCFLTFYQCGIPAALQDAELLWAKINSALWTSAYGPDHFAYGGTSPTGFECEAGGFETIITKLWYLDRYLANTSRLIQDMSCRFLDRRWYSYQWYTGNPPANSYFMSIHHNPANAEMRLENTLMHWGALLGMVPYFNVTQQASLRALMTGGTWQYPDNASMYTYQPAWQLLFNATNPYYSHTIWDAGTSMFRESSGQASGTLSGTVIGVNLLFVLGMVPQSAYLAVPVTENRYQDWWKCTDGDLFHLDIPNRIVRLSLTQSGTIKFLWHDAVTYNFGSDGVWDVTFAEDWDSVVSATRVSDLPSNRKYMGQNPEIQGIDSVGVSQYEGGVWVSKDLVYTNTTLLTSAYNEPTGINASVSLGGPYATTVDSALGNVHVYLTITSSRGTEVARTEMTNITATYFGDYWLVSKYYFWNVTNRPESGLQTHMRFEYYFDDTVITYTTIFADQWRVNMNSQSAFVVTDLRNMVLVIGLAALILPLVFIGLKRDEISAATVVWMLFVAGVGFSLLLTVGYM